MSEAAPWGVYVHVPWCRRRCPYCAFYVEVDRQADQPTFTRAVCAEFDRRSAEFLALGPPSTVFFGGGTPSRLDPAFVAEILATLQPAADAEISLEANPEDLDPARLAAYLRAGVNRLSIGLQTLDPDFARLLNRNSTVRQARQAIAHTASLGFSTMSVDLMFALPGQRLDQLDAELDGLLALDVPHIALYGLTYEPGTPFTRARDRGRLTEVDDETWRAMYERIAERLRAADFRRYEISNYARPGHESRHNRLYWTDRPYLGLGPSAHSYGPDGHRWANVADLAVYVCADDTRVDHELPTPIQAASDRLLSGLRAQEGVPLTTIARRGVELPEHAIRPFIEGGLLRADPARLILTDSGVALADALAARLCAALRIAPSMR